MLYFRENELDRLNGFVRSETKKALAVYGRRRTGKTALILHFMQQPGQDPVVYFQCPGYDYQLCLNDFKSALSAWISGDTILESLTSFKDVFAYLGRVLPRPLTFVIDEFPFLCKKDENVAAEFQWIIDHGLNGFKLILCGSNLSFMKRQLGDREAPLYGRFDDILEILPFTFSEVHRLYPVFEDAVNVYAQTGGVAQYVMFFHHYKSQSAATDDLFFQRDGRLLQEAGNLLLQEFRDTTTYISILRALSGGEKDSGQIAAACGMDPRGIFGYLAKLADIGVLEAVQNPLSGKKHDKRFRIRDPLFAFHYAFIEPNLSMIASLGSKSKKYILNDRYTEYLGFVYEDIIRSRCFSYAQEGVIPFMPQVVGKWWGNMMREGKWFGTEVDLVAYDNRNIVIGECKYRNKMVGKKELESLWEKAAFIPTGGRRIYYLLASKSGFTDDVRGEDVILIDGI